MSKRNLTIDIMRGVCISLVVLSHAVVAVEYETLKDNALVSMVCSFFMLTLFIISGYLTYGKAKDTKWLSSKIKRFGIPLAIFGVFFFFWLQWFPFGAKVLPESFAPYVLYVIMNGFNGTVLWFLWVLLLCYGAAFLFDNLRGAMPRIPVWATGLAAFVLLQVMPGALLGFFALKWYGAAFILGYCLKAYDLNRIKNLMYISLIAFPLVGYLTDWMRSYQNEVFYFMGLGNIPNMVLLGRYDYLVVSIGMVLLGTMFVWSASQLIIKIKVARIVFVYLGVSSIGIYLLHMIFLRFAVNYWVSTLVALCLSTIAYWLLARNKYTAMLIGAPTR